jgi:integrating conjugative element protein (TIGR03761 family)
MTEVKHFSYNMGEFEADIDLILNTREAAKLWRGRPRDDRINLRPIIGAVGYFAAVHKVVHASKLDDPYGDWWLMMIENRIDLAGQSIELVSGELDDRFELLTPQLVVRGGRNEQPFSVPVTVKTPQGFMGLYQLIAFDKLAGRIEIARRMALMNTREIRSWGRYAAKSIRSLFYFAQAFKYSGANRTDFKQMNARAAAALERLGPIPPEVISGVMRSDFSPDTWRAMPKLAVNLAIEPLEQVIERAKNDASESLVSDFGLEPENDAPAPDEDVLLEDVAI